jgi:hypothetical protein
MTLWKTITLIFLLIITELTFGQTSCDTLSPDIVKKFDNYSQKKFSKLKNSKKLDLATAFAIATYFRQKNDTLCKQWYAIFLDLGKRRFDARIKDKELKASLLFKVGIAYYYTDNFIQAKSWFLKAVKAKYTSQCLDYYCIKTQEKLGEPIK